MAVQGQSLAVGTTAVLVGDFPAKTAIHLSTPSGNSGTVYVGGSSVNPTGGYPMAASASADLAYVSGQVWAVGSAASQVLNWLASWPDS